MKNKAIFFDRDGVINNDSGHYYIFRKEDFVFNEGIFESMKFFLEKNYLLFIISNQSGIAKQKYSVADVENLHFFVKKSLAEQGISITEIYFCPHHPDISRCLCRKPESLWLEKAAARFNIDLEKSFLIGDSQRDIEAAQKVSVCGILIEKNTNLWDFLQNSNFLQAF